MAIGMRAPLAGAGALGRHIARRLRRPRARPLAGRRTWRPAGLKPLARVRPWHAPALSIVALRPAEPGYGAPRAVVWSTVRAYGPGWAPSAGERAGDYAPAETTSEAPPRAAPERLAPSSRVHAVGGDPQRGQVRREPRTTTPPAPVQAASDAGPGVPDRPRRAGGRPSAAQAESSGAPAPAPERAPSAATEPPAEPAPRPASPEARAGAPSLPARNAAERAAEAQPRPRPGAAPQVQLPVARRGVGPAIARMPLAPRAPLPARGRLSLPAGIAALGLRLRRLSPRVPPVAGALHTLAASRPAVAAGAPSPVQAAAGPMPPWGVEPGAGERHPAQPPQASRQALALERSGTTGLALPARLPLSAPAIATALRPVQQRLQPGAVAAGPLVASRAVAAAQGPGAAALGPAGPPEAESEPPGAAAIRAQPALIRARRELPLAGPVPRQWPGRAAALPPGKPAQVAASPTAGIVQRAEAAPAATRATSATVDAGAAKETPAVDLDALARQVYEILRRRLRVERERSRGGA